MKPEEIDYNLGILADLKSDDGLTVVTDAEGEEVFYTANDEMAEYLSAILNHAEDIAQFVRQHPEAFTATPAGDSIIAGERWPPANNDKRTSPLERVLAYLQNNIEG